MTTSERKTINLTYETFFIEEVFLGPKVHSTSDMSLDSNFVYESFTKESFVRYLLQKFQSIL